MIRTLFNSAAASPTLQPLPIDVVSVQSQVVYGRVGNNVGVNTYALRGSAATPTVESISEAMRLI